MQRNIPNPAFSLSTVPFRSRTIAGPICCPPLTETITFSYFMLPLASSPTCTYPLPSIPLSFPFFGLGMIPSILVAAHASNWDLSRRASSFADSRVVGTPITSGFIPNASLRRCYVIPQVTDICALVILFIDLADQLVFSIMTFFNLKVSNYCSCDILSTLWQDVSRQYLSSCGSIFAPHGQPCHSRKMDQAPYLLLQMTC